jgi:hypothetical protein
MLVHSKHQRGYSNIQNTTYIIPTLIKQHIYYSNIQITRRAISMNNLCGALNIEIAPLVI